ncbi:MAG TPA: MATE family efflux transporter [Candidatus Hydrogenedentes bacterium]|nr:MATE family efflux transporter [Candidatus Hydrogenedentota bacterium]HPG67559.1 MATE family efflux transporter [Candidatus Hydrogenedentota bacterium]
MTALDPALTSGSITRSVWRVAWPVVLLNLVNGLHGLVDHLLVGNFVPSETNEANAGIGVAWQLFLVIVVFMASLLQGMNVLVARYTGRQDREMVSMIVYQTFLVSAIILVPVIAPLGYFMAPRLLEWFNATPGVQTHALPYMRILFTCGAPLFIAFLLTGAMQSSGNPKIPLALGVLTTALNVILSAYFIIVLHLGAAGAALGTCLAPCISLACAFVIILRGKTVIALPKHMSLKPDLRIIAAVARIGIPTGLQSVAMNVGAALLLGIIGRVEHSAAAQAAYTICYTQLFSLVLWTSFGLRVAAATVIGHNIGADKMARGRRGVYIAAAMGLAAACALGILYWTLPRPLLALFDATGQAITQYGVSLLRYLSLSGLAFVLGLTFTGGLQGAGDTKNPMYIAIITQIGVLLGICWIAIALHRLSTDLIWSAILVSHISRFLLTYAVFRRGRWATIRLEIARTHTAPNA